MKKTKNVLFIMTDQHRWDCLGSNGNKIIETPNLDQLANDGVNFSNSFTNGMACVPSRACLMSGQFVHSHGVVSTGGDKWLSKETPSLPACFSKNGYRSVGVGKMHFKPWYNLGGFDRRVFIESKYSLVQDEYKTLLKEMNLTDKYIGHHTPNFGKEYKSMSTLELPSKYHIDAYIGKRGLETLEELIEEKNPFFLMVSFCGPHDPYDPPPPYSNMYKTKKMPTGNFQKGELDILPANQLSNIKDMGKEHLNLTTITDKKKQEISAHYYGNISLIDKWVGKLIKTLKKYNMYNDSVIVFTSDHGEYLGDHNLYYKAYFPCDSDCKVPLIIKSPKLKKNTKCNLMVGNTDIMPSILSLVDLEVPYTCQGRNLTPFIADKKKVKTDYVVTYSEVGSAYRLRTKNYSYVYRKNPENEQLYDMVNDPDEINNLLNNNKNNKLREKMHRMLTNWFIDNHSQ